MEAIITSINKSDSDEVRVGFSEFEGKRGKRQYFYARVYYSPPGTTEPEDRLPGKNGLNLEVTMLPAMMDAITAAYKMAVEQKLIEPAASTKKVKTLGKTRR